MLYVVLGANKDYMHAHAHLGAVRAQFHNPIS